MKQTGIVRQLDKLGRIVLPMELRRTFDLNHEDYLEIFVENGRIVLQKYQPNCFLCGNGDDLIEAKGKYLCRSCICDLSNA